MGAAESPAAASSDDSSESSVGDVDDSLLVSALARCFFTRGVLTRVNSDSLRLVGDLAAATWMAFSRPNVAWSDFVIKNDSIVKSKHGVLDCNSVGSANGWARSCPTGTGSNGLLARAIIDRLGCMLTMTNRSLHSSSFLSFGKSLHTMMTGKPRGTVMVSVLTRQLQLGCPLMMLLPGWRMSNIVFHGISSSAR